jgi:predicted aspartyl protease
VTVAGQRRSAPTAMLVDSGASDTMIARDFLEHLGVHLSSEKREVLSFSGERHEADVAMATIRFGGGRFELRTSILAFPGRRVPILGMRDFFNRYLVAFDAGGSSFFVSEPKQATTH